MIPSPSIHPEDIAKARRDEMRWQLLYIANVFRPQGVNTETLLPIMRKVYADATELEIRQHLEYLRERDLVKVTRDPLDKWAVELTRYGIDMVEYTIDCEPGVGRPPVRRA